MMTTERRLLMWCASVTLGLKDADYTGRGTALLDANGDGLLDIVYGNWNAQRSPPG